MSRKLLFVLCGAMVLGLFAGCGGRNAMEPRPMVTKEGDKMTRAVEEPAWVTSPVRAFPDKAKDVFFGVGIGEAKIYSRLYLRKRTAFEYAKNEVQSQVESFVASVFKDYSEAAWTPSMDKATANQLTSSVQKSINAGTLVGARIADTWTDDATGDYYVLVELSMETVASQLKGKMAEVEESNLRLSAEKAHQELDEIIAEKRKAFNQ